MIFEHAELNLPPIERETIDGVRYYKIPDEEGLLKLVSITSVISHYNKEFFSKWRKKVGEEKANQITKKATSRGTDFHTLTEFFLKNEDCSTDVLPISKFLFQIAKKDLKNLNKIYGLEKALFSKELGVAGTVDCIAEYKGVPSIIDFKTSTKERKDEYNESYYIQGSAYAEMFGERTGVEISQVVILVVTEDGTVQEFVKEKHDYLNSLVETIAEWNEQNK